MLHFTFFINHIKCISDNNYSYVFPQVMMIRLQRLSLPVNEFSVAEGCVFYYALTKKVMKKVTNDVRHSYSLNILSRH